MKYDDDITRWQGRDGGAPIGGNHRNAKLTDEQRAEIRASDEPTTWLAKHYQVNTTTISRIRLGTK